MTPADLLLWMEHGLTLVQQAWVSVVIGSAIYYASFGTFVWPTSKCLCRASWCPWCHGTGTRVTFSRQALDALVRKAAGR